ncbi:MAG: hypothetical protein WEA58_08200 [Balneolaceae bacterium]
MKITNNLNIPIQAFIKIDDNEIIPAGKPGRNGQRQSDVAAEGGNLNIDLNRFPIREFIIIAEMSDIPEKNNIEGIKVIPGRQFPRAHHFEFKKENDIYKAVLHFDLQHVKDKKDFITHIDPDVYHPE